MVGFPYGRSFWEFCVRVKAYQQTTAVLPLVVRALVDPQKFHDLFRPRKG